MPGPQNDRAANRDPVLERVLGPLVEVRRSARRRRTVSAYRDGARTVVLIAARMSAVEEQRWVATMLARLAAREAHHEPGDADLYRRAVELDRRYLDGAARPAAVTWSAGQQRRWGSCTPADGTIRLSRRLSGLPRWVIDYVLVHELAHLLVPDHSARFWAMVCRYPLAERARGYLLGAAAVGSSVGSSVPPAVAAEQPDPAAARALDATDDDAFPAPN